MKSLDPWPDLPVSPSLFTQHRKIDTVPTSLRWRRWCFIHHLKQCSHLSAVSCSQTRPCATPRFVNRSNGLYALTHWSYHGQTSTILTYSLTLIESTFPSMWLVLSNQIFTSHIQWMAATDFPEAHYQFWSGNLDRHGVTAIVVGDKGKGDAELYDSKWTPSTRNLGVGSWPSAGPNRYTIMK